MKYVGHMEYTGNGTIKSKTIYESTTGSVIEMEIYFYVFYTCVYIYAHTYAT